MPETDLEKKVNEIHTAAEVIKSKLDTLIMGHYDLDKRLKAVEEWKATETGFKKGVIWIVGLLGGGAGAAITKLLS